MVESKAAQMRAELLKQSVCPITNAPCGKERCGWWSEDSQKCAVLVAAESLKKGVKK